MRRVKAVPEVSPEAEFQYDAFYKMSYPRLLAYLVKVSGQVEIARDICQDIYLQLWEKRDTLPAREEEQLPYLFTMARNAFYQFTRKALQEQKKFTGYTQHDPASVQGPDHSFELKEQANIIQKVLDTAESDRKKYFLLNREEGLTYKQIAEREGVSEKTVERYIGSILKSLRTHFSSFLTFFW
ncbi:MAG: sigma-70 family RNA polymerase sigma factor [Chitinophagaceae bacterium]|nr:sigma-70 family RNA polymerase sigma factor [Chitinophagaceae bacterium]